jgi:hypothetical protein
MNAEGTRQAIGGIWTERADGWWLPVPAPMIQNIARTMLEAGARFSAIVALPDSENTMRISWHWDIGGVLLSAVSEIALGTLVPSIVETYPGADWAERETRDYYAVAFEGRTDTLPLMLRDGDKPGVLLCKVGEKL